MRLGSGVVAVLRRVLWCWAAAAWALALHTGACAADASPGPYPARRISLVVPFAPGGSTDLLGRLLADGMSRQLGVPVVIDNRPGAGTAVAAEFVARSAPDGYTLLLGSSSTFVFNPLISPKLRYDPDSDFTGVTLLASAPMVLLTPSATRAETYTDWLQRVRAHPGQFNFGSPGRGSSLHLAFEDFMAATGVRMLHIPYKGSQPALTALASGEVDAYVDLVPTAKAAVDGGLVRALGLFGSKRSAAMPAVPTLAEMGGPKLEVSPLFALVAPSGTPKPIVHKLQLVARRVLEASDVGERLRLLSFEVEGSAPEQVMPRFKADRSRWAQLIRERAIVVEP